MSDIVLHRTRGYTANGGKTWVQEQWEQEIKTETDSTPQTPKEADVQEEPVSMAVVKDEADIQSNIPDSATRWTVTMNPNYQATVVDWKDREVSYRKAKKQRV